MKGAQAVVIGRNYTSLLNMIRAAGEAGCEVTVIRTVRKFPSGIKRKFSPEAVSKYVKRYEYAIEPDRDGLVNLLLKLFRREKNVVLLPTDDFAASTIDLNQERLKNHFLFPNIHNQTGAVMRLMDKDVQKALARAEGLNVAEGWIAEVKNGEYSIPDGIRYPVFTKPQISINGNKRCMKRCNNREELEAVIKEVASERDCPILIEQYVEIEKEYGVLGFCGPENVVLPSLVDKLEIGHGSHQGVTMIGEVHPMEEYAEIQEQLKLFLKKTGFIGLIDIDLYESNGVLYFNELNLRLGAFGFAAMCAGINLPGMLIDTLLGKEIKNKKTKMDRTIRCISEKVNLDDYSAGYLDYKHYRKNLKSTEYRFIKSKSDPMPYRCFKIKAAKQILKRTVKNARKR